MLDHLNRGAQYAAKEPQALHVKHESISHARCTGSCYDNAVMERFFATLTWKFTDRVDEYIRIEAKAAILEAIDFGAIRNSDVQRPGI